MSECPECGEPLVCFHCNPPTLDTPMARVTDPDTSHETAAVIKRKLGKLLKLVLLAIYEQKEQKQRVTVRFIVELPRFRVGYGETTIGKRVYDLHKRGFLRVTGKSYRRTAPARIYGLTKKGRREARRIEDDMRQMRVSSNNREEDGTIKIPVESHHNS